MCAVCSDGTAALLDLRLKKAPSIWNPACHAIFRSSEIIRIQLLLLQRRSKLVLYRRNTIMYYLRKVLLCQPKAFSTLVLYIPINVTFLGAVLKFFIKKQILRLLYEAARI